MGKLMCNKLYLVMIINYYQNDCCLSWDMQSGQLYLLETIPGLRFRSRQKFQDKELALLYFRNLVEEHAAGRLEDSTMQTLLGTEYFNTLFSYSLQYIQCSQWMDIHLFWPRSNPIQL